MADYACAESIGDYDCEGAAVGLEVGPSQLLILVIYLLLYKIDQNRSDYYAPKVGLTIDGRNHYSHHKSKHFGELGEVVRA